MGPEVDAELFKVSGFKGRKHIRTFRILVQVIKQQSFSFKLPAGA